MMTVPKYESMVHHMKGFIQGFLFILIIIIIIAFFHFIGYLDKKVAGNDYYHGSDNDIEYWNEDIERSEGVRSGSAKESDYRFESKKNRDFGSKPLNEQDREKAKKEKEEANKKSYDYLKSK